MTDPLDLFERAVRERPPAAAPSRTDTRRSLTACLEAASQAPTALRPTALRPRAPWLLVGVAAAAVVLLTAWLTWPGATSGTPNDGPSGWPSGPLAQVDGASGRSTSPPAWEVVHDDPTLLETLRAQVGGSGMVAAEVVTQSVDLDRFRIDDSELEDWLQSIGLRPARIRIQGETRVLDLVAAADTALGE